MKGLNGTKRLVILTHDNPDPDCVSCACALQVLVTKVFKIPAIVRYTGIIGRAENREMIRLLKLKIRTLSKSELKMILVIQLSKIFSVHFKQLIIR